MRPWKSLLLGVALAGSACVSPFGENRTSRGEIESILGARPAQVLPVGDDHALVVWEFHRLWPGLEPAVERFVALEDSGRWILWCVREPEVGPPFDEADLIGSLPWLLDEERTRQERAERLAQLGLLED